MNRTNPSAWRYIGPGALAGLLIIGFVGRFTMAGLALLLGYPANLSAASVLVVMLLGAMYGAVGGLLLHLLITWGVTRGRGVITAAALWLLSLFLLKPQPGIEAEKPAEQLVTLLWHNPDPVLAKELVPVRLATIATALLIYLVYGIVLERWLSRKRQSPAG